MATTVTISAMLSAFSRNRVSSKRKRASASCLAASGVVAAVGCALAVASRQRSALLPQVLPPATPAPKAAPDLRTYGVGAQILRELGVTRMKLLGSPRRMPSMTGYGLEVTGFVAA